MHKIKKYFSIGSPIYSYILNTLFLIYATLLPFSNAFDIHTGPYLIVLFWILEGNFSKKLQIFRTNRALSFLILFFVILALSLLWSDNIHKGYKELKYYFATISLFVAVSTSLKKEFIKPAIYLFLSAMFISEIYSYGIFFEVFTPKGANASNPAPPYIHHLRYSIFLAVTAIILLSKMLDIREKRVLRVFEALFFISTTTNLFLNGGRTGQLAFLVAFAIFIIYKYGFRVRSIILSISIIIFIVAVAYNLSPIFHDRANLAISDTQNILQKHNLQNSWGERVAMKIVALDMIKNHPLMGEGIGDAMDIYKEYIHTPKLKEYAFTESVPHVHDQYMQIAIQSGLVSLAIFLLFLLSVWRIECENTIDSATLHSILIIFIVGFFTDVLLRNYIAGLFGFILALFIMKCRNGNLVITNN